VPPAGAGLVVGRFTARPAWAGGLRLAARWVARLQAVLSRGLLSPSPLMRARRHPLPRAKPADTSCAFHRGVVFYFLPQACLPEFTPHRASLWYGGGLLRFE